MLCRLASEFRRPPAFNPGRHIRLWSRHISDHTEHESDTLLPILVEAMDLQQSLREHSDTGRLAGSQLYRTHVQFVQYKTRAADWSSQDRHQDHRRRE